MGTGPVILEARPCGDEHGGISDGQMPVRCHGACKLNSAIRMPKSSQRGIHVDQAQSVLSSDAPMHRDVTLFYRDLLTRLGILPSIPDRGWCHQNNLC